MAHWRFGGSLEMWWLIGDVVTHWRCDGADPGLESSFYNHNDPKALQALHCTARQLCKNSCYSL